MSIQTFYTDQKMTYQGGELRPHFILEKFNLRGSAILAFRGPCEVQTKELVDWEDRLNEDFIRAGEMIHFLGEFFGWDLKTGVLLQRLMIAKISEELRAQLSNDVKIEREGDDLFLTPPVGERGKLTVSIVTASPVSVLMHIGVNIDPNGAPVIAIGLGQFSLEIDSLIQSILKSFEDELKGVEWACAKVRPVF